MQKDLEKNVISFESPKIEDLDSGKKFGVTIRRAWSRPLTEKASLPLKLVGGLSKHKFFQFQNFSQTMSNRAFI